MPRFLINSPPIDRSYSSVCKDLKKAIQKLGDSEGLWSFEDKSIQSILCFNVDQHPPCLRLRRLTWPRPPNRVGVWSYKRFEWEEEWETSLISQA